MSWDSAYRDHKHLWGERPSELASFAVDYLLNTRPCVKTISVIDVGCGYGRDTFYLSQHINCTMLGIDSSPEAIEMATKACLKRPTEKVRFQCCDFAQLGANKHDIVFISNVYQVLEAEQRAKLREVVKRILRPDGLLFLSTLSVADPEHYGKGFPVANDENSFLDEKYLHFCTREELEEDFGFLSIKGLCEHEYHEPRAMGETHHHVSWLLVGQNLA